MHFELGVMVVERRIYVEGYERISRDVCQK